MQDDIEDGTARVRTRIRRLLLVVIGSFLMFWSAVLVDAMRQASLREHIQGELYPLVRQLELLRSETALLDSLLARAIGEHDTLLLHDAELKVGEIDVSLARLGGDAVDNRQLTATFRLFAQESLSLVSDVLEQNLALGALERRVGEREQQRRDLFAAVDTRLGAAEGALADAFGSMRRHARNSAASGAFIAVLVVIVVAVVIRTAGHMFERMTRRIGNQARHFAALYNETPAMLATMDADQCCLSVSDFWLRETGYTRDAVLGRPVSDWLTLDARLERDRAVGWEEYEGRLRRADGDIRNVLLHRRLHEDEGGTRWLNVLVDLTERRRAERDLRELNETLEHRVGERTAELSAVNATLVDTVDRLRSTTETLVQSEKLAALGSLVAGVSHELNTPIGNAVMVATTLHGELVHLKDDLQRGLRRSDLDRYLHEAETGNEILLRNLERSAELIQSFKRVAVDQTSVQRRRFDLKQAIDELVLTLRPSLKSTPYTVEVDVPPGIRMDSYPGPLGQIIANCFNNALLHAFEGRDHGSVRIEATLADDNRVRLVFRDDGCGMTDEQRRHAFEPFFTTRLGQGGSGLGLHIVYNLATGVLGGEMSVRSTLGAGTEFALSLPLIAPVASVVQPSAE
jgi:PAS domain S-box-containing protein